MYPICAASVVFFRTPTLVWRTTLCTRCTPITFLYMMGIFTIQIHLRTVLERGRNTCKRAIIILSSRRRSQRRFGRRGPMAVVGMVRGQALPICRQAPPVEEFPTLQDLISLEDPDAPPLWGSADLLEGPATETVTMQDLSAITVTVLTNQSCPSRTFIRSGCRMDISNWPSLV